MNEQDHKEEVLDLFKEIESSPDSTQRSLSQKLNISLGKTNYILKALIKRGSISIVNFTSKDEKEDDSKVSITQCQIIRQKRNPHTNRYEYAMEFKKIAGNEQEKLTELFYRCQRDYLRQRRLFKV